MSEGVEAADEGDTLVLPHTVPEKCEFSAQTEEIKMVDASTQCEAQQTSDTQSQFAKDASGAALADHTYCIAAPQTV